jgi:hypothetical protein
MGCCSNAGAAARGDDLHDAYHQFQTRRLEPLDALGDRLLDDRGLVLAQQLEVDARALDEDAEILGPTHDPLRACRCDPPGRQHRLPGQSLCGGFGPMG